MALYLGSDKVKVILDNTSYHLNLVTITSSVVGAKLLSLDDYILKDLNGLYLMSKEED